MYVTVVGIPWLGGTRSSVEMQCKGMQRKSKQQEAMRWPAGWLASVRARGQTVAQSVYWPSSDLSFGTET